MKKNLKYILSIGLCTALFLSSGNMAVYANAQTTQILIENNVIEENTPIMEDESITRGNFILLFNKTFRINTSAGNPFADVAKDSPYYYDAMAGRRSGYLSGMGNNNLNPNDNITRAELATMVSKMIDKPTGTKQIAKDAKSIPSWASDSVDKIVSLGIMNLDQNKNFNPQNQVTYGETFDILSQVIEKGYNNPREDRILNFTAFDNYQLTGRLCMPKDDKNIDKLVIYVNGSGPNTYLDGTIVNDYRYIYHDFLADNFVKDGTAYFSYNTRGVSLDDGGMTYKINDEQYKTYLPENSAKDIKVFVDGLRKIPALSNAKIYLLGWSEGTMIAPHAVMDEGAEVDGLLLAGYCNGNMKDALDYQMDGMRDFYQLTIYFNCLGKDSISKEEYEKDPYKVIANLYGGAAFAQMDTNKDGVITKEDFALANKPFEDEFYKAIQNNDNAWLRKNYPISLTAEWFNAHFAYGKNIDTMAKVTIPIYIFEGTYDMNTPYQDALSAKETFKELGKTNLTVNMFDKEDHNLNFNSWIITNQASQGFSKIFEVVENELK